MRTREPGEAKVKKKKKRKTHNRYLKPKMPDGFTTPVENRLFENEQERGIGKGGESIDWTRGQRGYRTVRTRKGASL